MLTVLYKTNIFFLLIVDINFYNSFFLTHCNNKIIIICLNISGFKYCNCVFNYNSRFYNFSVICSQSPGARICISPSICTWGTTYTVSSRTNLSSRFSSWRSRKNLSTCIRRSLVCSSQARSLSSCLLSLRTDHLTKCASCLRECWMSPCQEGRSLLDFHVPQTHSPDSVHSARVPRHGQDSCWL